MTINTRKIQLLCAALLSIDLLQSPLQATIKQENPVYYKNALTGAGIAVALYIGYNYLIRQEYLVCNKFPIAQTWYDKLAKKYPEARLDQKQFIQKPKLSIIPDALTDLANTCNWVSSADHIYFSDDVLTIISILHQKEIDGYPLSQTELLSLARYEFELLHEAGHLEHDDAKDIMITIAALLALTHGYNLLEHTSTPKNPQDVDLFKALFQTENATPDSMKIMIPGILTIPQGITFMAGLLTMLRYQESRADKFACSLADDNTLKGAITIFENEELDKLYDLENKKITPYIKTNSTVGKIIQNVAGPVELLTSIILQQAFLLVKRFPETRWCFDFVYHPAHPGPSIRAKNIKNELAHREHHEQ